MPAESHLTEKLTTPSSAYQKLPTPADAYFATTNGGSATITSDAGAILIPSGSLQLSKGAGFIHIIIIIDEVIAGTAASLGVRRPERYFHVCCLTRSGRVAWIVRLVQIGAGDNERFADVMTINRPDDLDDIANLGLTVADGKRLLAGLQQDKWLRVFSGR